MYKYYNLLLLSLLNLRQNQTNWAARQIADNKVTAFISKQAQSEIIVIFE